MKKLYFIVVLIFISTPCFCSENSFSIFPADTDNIPDSTLAEQFIIKADSLYNNSTFDSALAYYEKAAVIFKRMEDWESYVYCLLQKVDISRKSGNFSEAVKICEEVKPVILEELNGKHILMVDLYRQLGLISWKMGDYDTAKEYMNNGKDLAELYGNVKDSKSVRIIGYLYFSLGIIYFETGSYDEAIEYYNKSLDFFSKHKDELLQLIAFVHSNLGIIYDITGYYDKAIYHQEKALEIYLYDPEMNLYGLASLYVNIAITLSERKGDYDTALLYSDKALNMMLELFGEESENSAVAYYNKGDILFKKGDPEEALNNFKKALYSFKSVYLNEEHTDIAMTYNSMGEVYESLSDYDKAYEYYEKALSIRLNIFGEKHLNVAKGYNNLGTIKRLQKKYDESVKYHKDALNIQKEIFGEHHPEIADSYNLLGIVYRDMREYEISLQHFQNAMIANIPSFSNPDIKINPYPERVLSETRLLASLGYKAETLFSYSEDEKGDISILQTAFETYRSSADLIDKMRSSYKAEGSKLFLAEKSAEIYEKAIKTSTKLNDITSDNKYLNEAFYFCEKSKARILQEAINESQAINYSGIPDSLVNREKQLKTDLTFYENQLQEEKYKKDNIDSMKIEDYESRVFDLSSEYQQLVADLESEYPKYYSSKYFDRQIDIKDVQKSLRRDEALLEYFIGSMAINLYYFTAVDYELFTINIESGLNEIVNDFYYSINSLDKNEYLSSANKLYNLLIKPVENLISDKQKLIIIPDGQLYYMPFEALITGLDPDNAKDFSKQNYLINRFDISYHYSTSLLIESNNNLTGNTDNSALIGFAPVFKDSPTADLYVAANVRSVYSSDDGKNEYRFINNDGRILALPYSEEELKYILNLFDNNDIPADGYFYDIATKDNFFAEAGKYKYIHLATHSFVNPEKPQHSGIILSQPEDTLSSVGTLYSNEIYNLDLHADLVVLSSCESGIGKLVKGEGMMALTRGFLYAGADNIITSLWKVYDKSTALLMKSFYRNVLNNRTYSEALREAKLEMIADKRTAFPVNWSGFVLIGK